MVISTQYGNFLLIVFFFCVCFFFPVFFYFFPVFFDFFPSDLLVSVSDVPADDLLSPFHKPALALVVSLHNFLYCSFQEPVTEKPLTVSHKLRMSDKSSQASSSVNETYTIDQ